MGVVVVDIADHKVASELYTCLPFREMVSGGPLIPIVM